jgi:hypothetical protein
MAKSIFVCPGRMENRGLKRVTARKKSLFIAVEKGIALLYGEEAQVYIDTTRQKQKGERVNENSDGRCSGHRRRIGWSVGGHQG